VAAGHGAGEPVPHPVQLSAFGEGKKDTVALGPKDTSLIQARSERPPLSGAASDITAQWRWSELRCDGAASVVPRDFAAAVTLDYEHVLLHGGHTGLKVTPHSHSHVHSHPS
jgi:hypothetical protein